MRLSKKEIMDFQKAMYEVGDAAEQMVNFPKMLKEGKSKIANFGESINEETIQEFRDSMYELGDAAEQTANLPIILKGGEIHIDKILDLLNAREKEEEDKKKEEELPKIISRPGGPLPEKKKTTEEIENEMAKAAIIQEMADADNVPKELVVTAVDTIPVEDIASEKNRKTQSGGRPLSPEGQSAKDWWESDNKTLEDFTNVPSIVKEITDKDPDLDPQKVKTALVNLKNSLRRG